jgi:hypothetical protein
LDENNLPNKFKSLLFDAAFRIEDARGPRNAADEARGTAKAEITQIILSTFILISFRFD